MRTEDILKKFSQKIEQEIGTEKAGADGDFSREYLQFKKDMMPSLSKFEKWCKSLGNVISLKLSQKDAEKMQKSLDVAHLDVTPSQVVTFSIISFFISFLVGTFFSIGIYFLTNKASFPFLLLFLFFLASIFLFYYIYSMPARLANRWRLKASSQMVPAILYVVVYMKHTSNLERAIRFAGQHLQPPLALDFRKVFWDVETGRYSTIKESLDSYLGTWREHSVEFIESFHLIESSLYEPSETRRVEILERALQVILDGIYERMLSYTRGIRSPLTNLYMLGIILPTLGLALLPLASTLLQGVIKYYHVFVLFNLIIPFFVFYLTSQIMLRRPGGYGETDLLELNPLYYQYKSKRPYLTGFLICMPLFLIGILPFIFQYTPVPVWLGLQRDYTFTELGLSFFGDTKIFDFHESSPGPFGVLAVILSLFIPLSIALFFSIAYSMKTRELVKAREHSKQLEQEFTSSLFQLGNRIGDGIPAEIAFAKVAESSKGLATEDFFRIVNTNLNQAGMSLEQAIFNEKRGAIIYYPSDLIRMSMKILVESVKKGLQVAARSLMSISDYVKNVHKINERLHDLLAEIVSDMKSNMTFLAPLLAGIIVGLSSMITLILSKLQLISGIVGEGNEAAGLGVGLGGNLLGLFDVTQMIPPYFLQIAIGIYIIQITFILTSTLVTIDSGEDKLKSSYDLAGNLRLGCLLYFITALLAILALSILAAVALGGIFT